MFKKKLLVIAGAGASVESGISSVSQIDTIFKNKADALYKLENNKNLYEHIRDSINNYYQKGNSNKTTNYEEILYILYQLSSLYWPLKNNPLNSFVNHIPQPKVFDSLTNKYRTIEYNDYDFLAHMLIDELLLKIRDECLNLNKNSSKVLNFIRKINNAYNVGVMTTNHDNIFMQAIPTYYTGFDTNGYFQKEKILNRRKWKYCYYMHGSVHFDMKRYNNDLHHITWNKDLNSTFNQNSSGRNSSCTMEGLNLPTSTIVAGYDKLNQIQKEPFRTYYNKMEKEIFNTDRILIIGYGFNDYHINKLLENYTNKKKKSKIVVISYSDNKTNPLPFRHDTFSNNLVNTLSLNKNEISGENTRSTVGIATLKNEYRFEVSNDRDSKFSLWHNGFIAACDKYDRIVSKL